ncbi:MAG: S-layer homology domain-containing protein [Cyanobacteriota bacterium]|nr:S-layer homology domain-containing protein [Cyanobacteriota bacterium]
MKTPDTIWDDIIDHWAENCLRELGYSGLFAGYPDNTFRPDRLMTRAEFAAALNKAFPNTSVKRDVINFSDISSSFWANDVIRWATERQFLSGYPDGTFRPQQNIPRVQALVALASGLNLEANPQLINSLSQLFEDAEEIPSYAKSAVAASLEQRMVASPNNPKKLTPNQSATRAEVAVFIAQSRLESGQVDRVDSRNIIEPLISPDFLPPNPWKNNQLTQILPKAETAVNWHYSQTTIAWSYSEEILGSYQPETGITLWNVETGNALETIAETANQTYHSFALNNTADLIAFHVYDAIQKQVSLKLLNRTNQITQTLQTFDIPDDFSLDNQKFISLLEFSPNGERVASVTGTINPESDPQEWKISIWDVKTGETVQVLSIQAEKLEQIVFSHDNQKIATYNTQEETKIWNVNTGELLYTLNEEKAIDNITFSLDSDFLLSAVLDFAGSFPIATNVRVWQMSTGKLRFDFSLPVDRTSENRTLSGDGRTYFASGTVEGANFFNVGNDQKFGLVFPPNISPMSIYGAKQNLFSPQGTQFAMATSEGIFIWRSSD